MTRDTPTSNTASHRFGVSKQKHLTGTPSMKYVFPAILAVCMVSPDVSYALPDNGGRNITSSSGKYFLIGNEIKINGESFYVTMEDNLTIISHPKWSIMGFGEDLRIAKMDLKESAEIIAPDYIYASDSDLTPEAIGLKEFLIKFLG